MTTLAVVRCRKCNGAMYDDQDLQDLAEQALEAFTMDGKAEAMQAALLLLSDNMACRLGACSALPRERVYQPRKPRIQLPSRPLTPAEIRAGGRSE